MHNSIIYEFLSKLNFDEQAIMLYEVLVQNGPQTLLSAARLAKIERTRLYRIIDDLAARGLIQEIPGYKRSMIKAVDLNTFQMMINQKEIESKFLQSSLPSFMSAVESFQNPFPGSDVVYYHGKEGIKQLTWHMLRCKQMPFRGYSCQFWDELFGEKFNLDLNQELLSKNFQVHDIYSDAYIKYSDDWIKAHGPPKGDWKFWESRYISEKILKVQINMDVYDNTVDYYYWGNGKLFGVEINDPKVALFHKQTFDMLWKLAKPRGGVNWKNKTRMGN